FPVPRVRDPLEEQDREHVPLEVRGVDRAAEAVRCGPQAGFEVAEVAVAAGDAHVTRPLAVASWAAMASSTRARRSSISSVVVRGAITSPWPWWPIPRVS